MVDRYWPDLEWDFQEILGLNAMEWINSPPLGEGETLRPGEVRRDWRQFYRFKEQLPMGSAYWAAKYGDEELAEEVLAQMPKDFERRQRKTVQGVPLRGWTPLKEQLTAMNNHLILLRASMTGADGNEVRLAPYPETAIEKLRRKKSSEKLKGVTAMLLRRPNDSE